MPKTEEKQQNVFSNVLTKMTTVEVVCWKYKPLKNNEFPIKIKISKDRKTRYINLNVSTKIEDWDFERNQPKPSCPNKELLDKLIAKTIGEARSQIVALKSEEKEFTATSLVEQLVHPHKLCTVAELFKQQISRLIEENRTRYALSVQQVYNSLLRFNKHLDLYFSEIDLVWLKRYETWLRKEGIAENTIGIRFRTLRMVYNLAIEAQAVNPELYPFKRYKVSKLHQQTAKRAISKEETKAVIEYPTEGKDLYMCLAVDLFAFSYLMGGINFTDIAYLTPSNIQGKRLVYIRKKTGKLIHLPLQQKALDILQKYEEPNGAYLFPIFSNYHKTEQQRLNRLHKVITKINEVLKSIGQELKIPIKLTTYVARHSYATVLKRAGVSTSVICESLGHSSEKVTQIYLDSFDNEQIDRALDHLL